MNVIRSVLTMSLVAWICANAVSSTAANAQGLTAMQLVEQCFDSDTDWEQCYNDAIGNNLYEAPEGQESIHVCVLGGGSFTYCFPDPIPGEGQTSDVERMSILELFRPRSLWTKGPYDLSSGL